MARQSAEKLADPMVAMLAAQMAGLRFQFNWFSYYMYDKEYNLNVTYLRVALSVVQTVAWMVDPSVAQMVD